MPRCIFLLFCILGTTCAFPQSSPTSNPEALAFAAKSIAALAGSTAIKDITLTGNITWTAGSDIESGTATLLASGATESRMDLVFSTGTRSEIRDASTGTAEGEWILENGTSGLFAPQNCWTDAVWFYPVLGSLAAGPGVMLSYIGQETRRGQSVQHVQSYVYQGYQYSGPGVSPQQLTTMDFYLDASTLLPAAVVFNAHLDKYASTNVPVEIDFTNYESMAGIVIPAHIQRFVQNTLQADLTVTGASINTGIPLSEFAIN